MMECSRHQVSSQPIHRPVMKSKICVYLWFEQLLLLHIRKMVIFQLGFQMGIRGFFFKIRLANKINYIKQLKISVIDHNY